MVKYVFPVYTTRVTTIIDGWHCVIYSWWLTVTLRQVEGSFNKEISWITPLVIIVYHLSDKGQKHLFMWATQIVLLLIETLKLPSSSHDSDLTLSQAFLPMAAQLSKKAVPPLVKVFAIASCRSSKTGIMNHGLLKLFKCTFCSESMSP